MPLVLPLPSSRSPLSSTSVMLFSTPTPTPKALSTYLPPTYSFASLAAQNRIGLQHAHTLTVLHKTHELVARILPPQSLEQYFWNEVLDEVSHEVTRSNLTSKEDRVSIVFYAVDEFSGGESLVSALLQDPFSPEGESVRISRRWEGREKDTKLDIEYAPPPIGDTSGNNGGPSPSSSHVMRLSSSFLESLPIPACLTELRPTRGLSKDNLRLLYTAHIPIILLNPLTTPLTTLFSHTPSNSKPTVLPYPLPAHALLLITSPSPISTTSSTPPAVFGLGASPNRVFFIDPDRALSSIRALRANPSNVLHVQRYSDDALASGLSMLRQQLQSIPTAMQKGDALVRAAVSVMRSSLDGVEAELREAAALVRTLRSETSQEREDAHRAVFGPASELKSLNERTRSQPPDTGSTPKVGTPTASHDSNKVRAAMSRADDDVLPVLDNMTWWRVLWAPDEVGWRMCQAVRDAWIGSIAGGLLPALAALPNTQSVQTSRALSRVTAGAGAGAATLPAPLRSHVLLNALSQLAHSPTFAVDPRALLRPLERRLARLDAGTTAALARAAQVLVLRVVGSVSAGAGAAASVMVLLAHWSAVAAVGEAAGAGLLVAAAGLRWAIGRWDKARKLWRGDWVRVKEAAERDVKTAIDEALETQVLIVPVRAAEGIEGIVAKRKDEIGHLRREVDKLDAVISDSQNSAHRSPDDS
ncbi:hypothetical protein BJV74DRAFT_886171 [Russula compacta]|nr:hypothetical protein BJV74DRAFT_886171 [Russula compacta]